LIALWPRPKIANPYRTSARREIDRLDEQIIRLLGERAQYVHAAARFKTSEEHMAAPDRQRAMMQVRRACLPRSSGRHAFTLDHPHEVPCRLEGFTPAVVVETSPGNFQAWLNHGQVLPKQLSTLAARTLAERFVGDSGAADWRHFGRLAGLTNRKPKHRAEDDRYPFVHLIQATGQSYRAAETALRELPAQLAERQRIQRSVPHPVDAGKARLTIDDFRAKPAYGGDGNRIDLAYTVYALTHGVSEADIRSIASRDLSKKGPEQRQLNYIERTIRKACSTLGR
jgi:chorismate mutase